MEKQLAAVGHTQREESIKWDLGKVKLSSYDYYLGGARVFAAEVTRRTLGSCWRHSTGLPGGRGGGKELGALIAILTKRGMCSDNKEQNMIIGGKVDKRTIARVG